MHRRLLFEAAILAAAILIAIGVRLFAVAVSVIPSESMLPTFAVGDVVLVAKWPYGWSGDGGPLARNLWRGRMAPRPPRRGDIAIFKAPPANRIDYVKRVIGLPGDSIVLRRGIVAVNGEIFAQQPIADLVVPITPNSPCRPEPGTAIAPADLNGAPACRYPRLREALPGGRQHAVIDLGPSDADDFGPVTVPPGRMFVLGDNRDRSADSRFPARDGGGVGMVAQDALVGRPLLILFSTDGSARWWNPVSWWRALRPGRTLRPL